MERGYPCDNRRMRRLVFVGCGHAHLMALRAFAGARPRGARLVVISAKPLVYYSGMVPGWIAGHYVRSQCCIELPAVIRAAGAEAVFAEAGGVDANARWVCLRDGRRIDYDVLSINVGGETDNSCFQDLGSRLLPVRPLQQSVEAWPGVMARARGKGGFRLVVVGAGAAGTELAMAAQHAFRAAAIAAQTELVASEQGCLPGFDATVLALVRSRLLAAGIVCHDGPAAGSAHGVLLADGRVLAADQVLAATGTRAPRWLTLSGLALDAEGRIVVDRCHRSISHPDVFSAGDVCSRPDVAMAHSGVHAVRAGKVLGSNLLAVLRGKAPARYRPRRRTLYLLSCGDRYAIASWGRWSAQGKWVWRWKDWIDRRFVDGFQRLADPALAAPYDGR